MNELQFYTSSIPDSNPNKAELIKQWKIENKWGQQEVEEVIETPVEEVKTEGDAAGAGVEPVEVAVPADLTESTVADGLSSSTCLLYPSNDADDLCCVDLGCSAICKKRRRTR